MTQRWGSLAGAAMGADADARVCAAGVRLCCATSGSEVMGGDGWLPGFRSKSCDQRGKSDRTEILLSYIGVKSPGMIDDGIEECDVRLWPVVSELVS